MTFLPKTPTASPDVLARLLALPLAIVGATAILYLVEVASRLAA
jgi:hypothetical protein